jgi:ESCRT-II complex subunit VPS36
MLTDQTSSIGGTAEPTEIPTTNPVEVVDGIACPACTFLNHISMVQCELCETSLFNDKNNNSSTATTNSSTDKHTIQLPDEADISSIKLSFRRGGQPEFMGALSKLLADRTVSVSQAYI